MQINLNKRGARVHSFNPTQTRTRPTPTHPIPSQCAPKDEKVKAYQTQSRAAPPRDFNRRANSLERDALPAGLFPGASKRLYDALYLRTRGAFVPTRTLQATKRDLMQLSAIKSKNTLDKQLKYLYFVITEPPAEKRHTLCLTKVASEYPLRSELRAMSSSLGVPHTKAMEERGMRAPRCVSPARSRATIISTIAVP